MSEWYQNRLKKKQQGSKPANNISMGFWFENIFFIIQWDHSMFSYWHFGIYISAIDVIYSEFSAPVCLCVCAVVFIIVVYLAFNSNKNKSRKQKMLGEFLRFYDICLCCCCFSSFKFCVIYFLRWANKFQRSTIHSPTKTQKWKSAARDNNSLSIVTKSKLIISVNRGHFPLCMPMHACASQPR